jgi:hypothetical protein
VDLEVQYDSLPILHIQVHFCSGKEKSKAEKCATRAQELDYAKESVSQLLKDMEEH